MRGLAAGDVLTDAGCELRVLATPGHTYDSVCLQLPADGAVLTGDTVLGRGTTVIARDGKPRRLPRLTGPAPGAGRRDGPAHAAAGPRPAAGEARPRVARLLPGAPGPSGWPRSGPALAAGDTTPAQIVERVYADVDPVLWPPARESVRAQLTYLADRGEVPPRRRLVAGLPRGTAPPIPPRLPAAALPRGDDPPIPPAPAGGQISWRALRSRSA